MPGAAREVIGPVTEIETRDCPLMVVEPIRPQAAPHLKPLRLGEAVEQIDVADRHVISTLRRSFVERVPIRLEIETAGGAQAKTRAVSGQLVEIVGILEAQLRLPTAMPRA